MAFQGAQELVAEKRILVGNQGVPLGGGKIAQSIKALNAHGVELAGVGQRKQARIGSAHCDAWNAKPCSGSPAPFT